jgi:DnaK suppressor protein
MAKTKSAKKSSAGKSGTNSKTKVALKKPVKTPVKSVKKSKPASSGKPKAASGKKAPAKSKAKPVVTKKVIAKKVIAKKVVKKPAAKKVVIKPAAKKIVKPVKKPAAPIAKTGANKAKPLTTIAAKPVPKQNPVAVKTGTNLASVSKVTPAIQKPKPSKTIPIMSSKETATPIAKPATPKTSTQSAASKNPNAGSGMASPLQAANKGFVPYVMQKGEEYMNDKQKDHFRKILLNWRDELMQEVDRTVHHMQDEAANPPDPADRATLEEEFSLELRTRDRERRLIKKIDSTIELIANDDYGYCDSCGVEIGIRRLEARPTASKCIDCKTLDEIKEKQIGSA